MRANVRLILFLLLMAILPARAQTPAQTPANAPAKAPAMPCLTCHGDPGLTTTQDGRRVSLYVDITRFSRSVHGKLACPDCHPGDPHLQGIPPELRGTEQGRLIGRIARPNAAALLSCSTCHPDEFGIWRSSIHGQAVLSGRPGAPICSDCHGNHYIRRVTDPESTVQPEHVPATCGSCHANQRLMAQYDINTNTVSTYSASFHGRRLALGSTRVAECSSCHGYHNIYPPTDPRSSVYPANRRKTCGKPGCHPGASVEFAEGFAHRIPSPRVEPLAYFVGMFYNVLVLGVSAGMLLWVLMDLFRRFRHKGAHWHAPHVHDLTVPPHMPIKRWDIHQRIQHMLLLVSFTMLVLTGVPMLFPISPVSRALVNFVGGPGTAGIIHRAMASLLILTAAYHMGYIVFRQIRGRLGGSILPRYKDLTDAYHLFRYYIGLAPDRPQAGRYTFDEKVEYWSMIWGTVIMILTGLVLWFPQPPARSLGVWSVGLARIIHGYEALLAAIAIIVWHFYHAHLNPDVFPMNQTWLTGNITAEELARHHPLEYKEMLDRGELKPPPEYQGQ